MSREYDVAAGSQIQATVHWCPADASHRIHVVVGARRGPGWYVFVVEGCRGRVVGPLQSEAAAESVARAATLKVTGQRTGTED